MQEQAAVLRDTPGLRPVIVLANRFMVEQATLCRTLGFDVLDLHDRIERRISETAPFKGRVWAAVHAWLARHDAAMEYG